MFVIPTILKESNIAGIGVFACTDIKKGDIIWKENINTSIIFTNEEIEEINKIPKLKSLFKKYACPYRGVFYMDIENSKFMNHSDDPNTFTTEECFEIVAKRDISYGEELTCDYNEFDDSNEWKSW